MSYSTRKITVRLAYPLDWLPTGPASVHFKCELTVNSNVQTAISFDITNNLKSFNVLIIILQNLK